MAGFSNLNLLDKSKTINLSRDVAWMKRGPTIDASRDAWIRIKPIVKALKEKGYIQRAFGRMASILPMGRSVPDDERLKGEYQDEIRAQTAINLYHRVVKVDNLFYPGRPVKVAYANGTEEERTMCIRDVILRFVLVPDTPEQLTWKSAFTSLIPINRGADAGSSMLTYLDDSKGALVKPGLRRKTKGPIVTLVENLQGKKFAPWIYWFMLKELKLTQGTVRRLMLSFQDDCRDWDDCEWDSATRTVHDPAYVPPQTTYNKACSDFAQSGIDLSTLDIAAMLSDKAKVDKQTDDDEEKARERLVNTERLYANPDDRRVGASGATAASGTSDANISTAPSAAKSTATENIRDNYRKMKMARAKDRTEREAFIDILRSMGVDPDEAIKRYNQQMGLTDEAPDTDNNIPADDADSPRGGGEDDSETDAENDDNNMNGERVRTEGAGRPGESARGGAARQGTHAEK